MHASLGIAVATTGDTPTSLLRDANTALHKAKSLRRGSFEFFDETLRQRLLRELDLKNTLERALADDELLVYYQPIVSLSDGGVLALEALVRWPHPEWGWVQPSEFIPIAERSELIVTLGDWMLDQVSRQLETWRSEHPRWSFGVDVNISARQLAQADFAPSLLRTLEKRELTAADVEIEVTEHAFLSDTDSVLSGNLRTLSENGVRLSLDDFGTGYSALSTLERLPFSALKIDRAFICAIRSTSDSAPFVTAIVRLGHALGLTVIAEGVESSAQANYLRTIGCDAALGYYFARPQPAGDIEALLDQAGRLPDAHALAVGGARRGGATAKRARNRLPGPSSAAS